MTYKIVKIDESMTFNLKGWRIVREDGASLQPFTTKAEAQKLVDFFGTEPASNHRKETI